MTSLILGHTGHSHGTPLILHSLEQAGEEVGGGVGAQRPRRVGVTDDKGGVGEILQHHAAPEELLSMVDELPVDLDRRAAADEDAETGRGDDDVRVEATARVQLDALGCDLFDGVGDDVGVAGAETLVEVAIGGDAESLVPDVVARLEVRVERDVRGQFGLGGGVE